MSEIALCRSDYYADTGYVAQPGHNSRTVRCNLLKDHDGDHDEMIDGEPGVVTWPRRLANDGRALDLSRRSADRERASRHVADAIAEAGIPVVMEVLTALVRQGLDDNAAKSRSVAASSRSEGVAEGWRGAIDALGAHEVLVVMVNHVQTGATGGCMCGWADLGRFHPRHLAEKIAEALASLTPTTEETAALSRGDTTP